MKYQTQRGVALVVTLILLAIITFLTIAFLAVSNRQRQAVSLTAAQTDAKLASDAAFERVEGEIAARLLASTNPIAFNLFISTNYQSPGGFQPGLATNRNVHDFDVRGDPLTGANLLRNYGNMQISPRVPVFIQTDANLPQAPLDYRFYLDFNRNGLFEPTDLMSDPSTGQTNFVIGDPQWIGLLENPQYTHSGTNRFLARYAYLVLPVEHGLDVNFIHNTAKDLKNSGSASRNLSEGFSRNQGFGPWEINFAAFLSQLNSNVWYSNGSEYNYQPLGRNSGSAFADALGLLRYRYVTNIQNFVHIPISGDSSGNALIAFQNDYIDGALDGPLWRGVEPLASDDDFLFQASSPFRWVGRSSVNPLFDIQDLFQPNRPYSTIGARLEQASRDTNTLHNRYTTYRLLSQLTASSIPETNRIHLNYLNVNAAGEIDWSLPPQAIPWTTNADQRLAFFTNAAIRILQSQMGTFPGGVLAAQQSAVGQAVPVLDIQVWPTNNYGPAVHRGLQVAANILDASIASMNEAAIYPFLPTVFRPQFRRATVNGELTISITNYVLEPPTTANSSVLNSNVTRFRDLSIPADRQAVQPMDMVYGVPLVIGAKKGLPNFNEVSMLTSIGATRKLQVYKNSPAELTPSGTNQMYIMGVTNEVGVELWNSYTNNYPRALRMVLHNELASSLADQYGFSSAPDPMVVDVDTTYAAGTWTGLEFKVPANTNLVVLSNSVYRFNPPGFESAGATNVFEQTSGFPVPQWEYAVTNKLWYALVDNNQIIDFVSLSDLVYRTNITEGLIVGNDFIGDQASAGLLWLTNRPGNSVSLPTEGILNQIQVSTGERSDVRWVDLSGLPPGRTKEQAIADFRVFVGLDSPDPNAPPPSDVEKQAPYTASGTLFTYHTWAANDPLVHYTHGDLADASRPNPRPLPSQTVSLTLSNQNLGKLNERYRPWGGRRLPGESPTQSSADSFNLAYQDPGVRWSDDWNFPTNKFPNVGWLGRVHRGTPWQTIYLKSEAAPNREPDFEWARWSGSRLTHPTNDWQLLGQFTVAPNESATRGLLSVNQSGEAAWAAVLSGVHVLTNSQTASIRSRPVYEPFVVSPATPQMQAMVNGINRARQTRPGGVFRWMGEVLATPELTVASPYLNTASVLERRHGLTDEAYERIPQQILSLLKLGETPRFLVYAYGQSVKPAAESLVVSPGEYFQMSTNYQVTGEFVARALLRFDQVDTNSNPELNFLETPPRYRAVIEDYTILSSD